VSDVYPSPWLRPEDLAGAARRVQVESVDVQGFRQRDGSTQEKIVVGFLGKQKRMILNVTQARALAEVAGSEEIDRWAGVQVVLTPARASNGKLTIAVHGVHDGG
jgi:hypothetical protein